MSRPKISVVMAAYNAEKYLRESIDSLLTQTFIDFELIVVNDGSTDGTLAILESYGDERLRIINNAQNLGLPKSLNIGIKSARGEYIARQDADDMSLPQRLEKQYAYMQANPQIALLGSLSNYLDGADNKVPYEVEFLPAPTFADLMKSNRFVHSAMMIRKTVLDKVGLYEAIDWAEDYELWLRIAKHYEVRNLQEVLVLYREHDYQLTKQASVERISLYGLLIHRCAIDKSAQSIYASVERYGIWWYYMQLSNNDKVSFHRRMARWRRNHRHYQNALRHYRKANQLQKGNWKVIRNIAKIKIRLMFSRNQDDDALDDVFDKFDG